MTTTEKNSMSKLPIYTDNFRGIISADTNLLHFFLLGVAGKLPDMAGQILFNYPL